LRGAVRLVERQFVSARRPKVTGYSWSPAQRRLTIVLISQLRREQNHAGNRGAV
jgi:hypothetical protein